MNELIAAIKAIIDGGDAPSFPAFTFGMCFDKVSWHERARTFSNNCFPAEDGDEDEDGERPQTLIAPYHDTGSQAAPGFPFPKGAKAEMHVGAELELGTLDATCNRTEAAVYRRLQTTRMEFRMEADSSLPRAGMEEVFEVISPYGSMLAQYEFWAPLLLDATLHNELMTRSAGTSTAYTAMCRNAGRAQVFEGLFGGVVLGSNEREVDTPRMGVPMDMYGTAFSVAGEVARVRQYVFNTAEHRVPVAHDGTPALSWQASAVLRRFSHAQVAGNGRLSAPFGMHVHVSNARSETRRRRVQSTALNALLSLLYCDSMLYLYLIGRWPDDNYHQAPYVSDDGDRFWGDGRYVMVARRPGTVEFRCFAATINPCMFFARAELAYALSVYATEPCDAEGDWARGDETLGGAWMGFMQWLADEPIDVPNLRRALELYPTYERYALDDYKGPPLYSAAAWCDLKQRSLPLTVAAAA